MKNVLFLAALATTVAFSAHAMAAKIDTDGDGMASLAELQAQNDGLTEELFVKMDLDNDGLVNDEEMVAAVDAGLIADPDADK